MMEGSVMSVCWAPSPQPGNVGDMVTPWLLDKCLVSYRWVSAAQTHKFLMCGSIAIWSKQGDVLWGTGNSHQSLVGRISPNVTVLAVRGPETAFRLRQCGIDCPDIYGDPALLLPRFFRPPEQEKLVDVGIVPHYKDVDLALSAAHANDVWNCRVIRPLRSVKNVATFVYELLTCRRIISSSLHGLILAHAYGLPARWVEFSDHVFGGGLKFRDYLQSVGLRTYEPRWPRDRDWHTPDLDIDLDRLWSTRPWT
jgi:pyruvyltransferase